MEGTEVIGRSALSIRHRILGSRIQVPGVSVSMASAIRKQLKKNG
jgi:hypothetical protein